jgi:diguanylate cyclase (GGDEF)-like protein
MEEWLLEAKGGGGPLVVAMCDVDGLGAVNAAYGQAVGDDVLSTVANRLARALQRDGAIGRYGGEEFVVVLPKADLGEAERMCERLRDSVDSRPVDTRDGRQVPATISIGVAATGGSVNSVPALVQAAYGALADAQRSGKNRVCSTFPPTDGTSSHPASAGEP